MTTLSLRSSTDKTQQTTIDPERITNENTTFDQQLTTTDHKIYKPYVYIHNM